MKTDPKRLTDIKRTYEEGAKIFTQRTADATIAQNGGTIDEVRKIFLSYLPTQALILDVGCGSGRDAKYFIEQGHSIVGVDICEPFIRELQDTTSGDFVVGDIVNENEYVYQKKYDGIWACASLVHLNREESIQTIKNCFSALKDGGCFFIGIKYSEGETFMDTKESKTIPGSFKTYIFYNEDDLRSDLGGAGFSILHSSIAEGPYGGDKFIQIFAQK